MRDLICGIDLGTTNSVISYLHQGRPEVLCVEEGTAIVPSVVSLDEKLDRLIVGQQARNRLAAFPDLTVRSVKRLMGKGSTVRLGAREFRPEDISSIILRHLVDKASESIGQQIRKAVITVPAYFDDAQRRATVSAGELAGLEVMRIINEPTAASLVYDHISLRSSADSPYIMVYDLGGGTFDVSILEIKGDIKEVLASCGDTALGGDDFDERLKEFLLRHLKADTGNDLRPDRALDVRLRDIAERTKIILSDQPYALVNEVAVATLAGEPVNLNLEISREEFEEMTADLIAKTVEKVEEALNEASLDSSDIGKIILVGGSTRMPAVPAALADVFDRPIEHSVDVDLCVAMGAAIQAGLIAGEPLGHILLDVTAHSLGVKTVDEIDPQTGEPDYFSVIIRRNSRIPASRSEVYFTVTDQQAGVEVEVYQGESPSCRENTQVGRFRFPLQPAPARSPVTVEFAYDREGIVHVCVDQKGYNNRKDVTLNVRKKALQEDADLEVQDKPVNYIAEKARRLIARDVLPQPLRKELAELARQYEKAIVEGVGDEVVDDLEDRLLGAMEQAEEGLADIG